LQPPVVRAAAAVGAEHWQRVHRAEGVTVARRGCSGLELGTWQATLPNNRAQCADLDLGVIGHGYCRGRAARLALHDDVAAPSAPLGEAILLQDAADFVAGEDT